MGSGFGFLGPRFWASGRMFRVLGFRVQEGPETGPLTCMSEFEKVRDPFKT